MANNNLTDVFQKNQYNLHNAARKSRAWFEQQTLILRGQRITANKALTGNPEELTTNIIPGNLYMFFYDPKTKADLPYYDKFPLVFPYAKTANGFMGLNMHYLPYQLRVQLLDRLMQFKNNDKMDETTKIRYSWALISGVSKYSAAQPCIKQYLNGHVKTSFRKINAKDWGTAMMLPVESFVGASKQAVWADSTRMAKTWAR